MLKAARFSTIRFIRDIAAQLVVPEGIGLNYVDWDAHADVGKLPTSDLYGLTGLGITDNEVTHDLVFGVTLSTYNDQNLFRMTDMTDLYYRRMRALTTFALLDPATGYEVGKIAIERGTTAMPIDRVETRLVVSFNVSASIVPHADFAAAN